MKYLNRKTLLIYLISFIIARASFYGMNPLAIGFFTAAFLGKTGGGFVFAAVVAGIASAMEPIQIFKYTLTLIVIVVVLQSPLLKHKGIPWQVLYTIPSGILLLFSLIGIGTGITIQETVVMAVLEALIAVVSAVLFKYSIDFIMQSTNGFRMNNEQMISMAVMMAVCIYAIPQFDYDYLAPMETAVFFVILFFTYKYGVGQGTITGAVCGFALSLRGIPATEAGMLAMMGVIPAVFREMGRLPVAVVFVITAALMGTVNHAMILTTKEIGALISAIAVFILLPGSIIYRVDAAGGTGMKEQLAMRNLRKIADTRMKIFSESFLKLSKTLSGISSKQVEGKPETDQIFEDISEKLCRNCINCSLCWGNQFKQTYQAACSLFESAQKNGMVKEEDIPEGFLKACPCATEFVAETNRGFELARLNRIWSQRITESREVVAEQLREVSSVIQDITGDLAEVYEASHTLEEKIAKRLRSIHVLTRDITIFERGNKRKEIVLSAACRGGRCVMAKEAAAMISEALGLKVKVSEASKSVISKDYESFTFIEDTKFKTLTGVARAMKDTVSGDNFSIVNLESGETMIALSDGMGTGKEAGDESEMVMSLLEQMVESGFKPETAIRLINSSLVLEADRQTFSTLDLSIINLFTGMCEFIKIGAAAAFIKRDNWVETITSTTLPIGMFGNVDYDTVTKKLYEGDIIVMLTDGVLDCIKEENKEAAMEQLILGIKSTNPQEIANRILDTMLTQSNYAPADDMSVITAGIWLK